MESLTEVLVKSYFEKNRNEIFGSDAIFVGYQTIRHFISVSSINHSYRVMIVTITYRTDKVTKTTKNVKVLVKVSETSVPPPDSLREFSPLNGELYFFETVLKFLKGPKPSDELFLQNCSSCSSSTPTWKRMAIIFTWPIGAAIIDASPLPYQRCSVMIRKIAQFHARSLWLKSETDELEFDRLSATHHFKYMNFNLEPVLVILRRCYHELNKEPQFAQNLDQFEAMLSEFECRLKAPFSRSSVGKHFWVMCHQNYGQDSVAFRGEAAVRSSCLGIFNCHSVGFASVGVDIVMPLLVEPMKSVRNECADKLVEDYRQRLHKVTGNNFSVNSIKAEIKLSVPFALYTLAMRIIWANSPLAQNSLFKPEVWTEEVLLDLCRYLVLSEFI